MKAVRIHNFDGLDALTYEDAPVPVPKKGELLVKIVGAGVNPIDSKVAQGAFEKIVPHTLPLTIGWDMSGIVDSVGPDVTRFKPGDAVMAVCDLRHDGAYAEYMVIDENIVGAKPSSIGFLAAAGVSLTGTTAWHALFTQAHLLPGQTVLIHGGGGSVGAFAVQFAKVKGARTIATASKDDLEYVKSIGADEVIDYKAERFEDIVKGVDIVIDPIGGQTQARSWQTLRDGGVLVNLLGSVEIPDEAKERGVIGKSFSFTADGDIIKQISELIGAGKVTVRVDSVYPLTEARKAQERVDTGHPRGKVVLQVSAEVE